MFENKQHEANVHFGEILHDYFHTDSGNAISEPLRLETAVSDIYDQFMGIRNLDAVVAHSYAEVFSANRTTLSPMLAQFIRTSIEEWIKDYLRLTRPDNFSGCCGDILQGYYVIEREGVECIVPFEGLTLEERAFIARDLREQALDLLSETQLLATPRGVIEGKAKAA